MRNMRDPLSARRQKFEAEAADKRLLPYNQKVPDDSQERTEAKGSTGTVRRNRIRVVGNVIVVEGLRKKASFVILRSDNEDCVWTENLRSKSVETDLVVVVRIRIVEVILLQHSDEEEEGRVDEPDLLQTRRGFL